jgi:hypothetical protein
MRFIVLTLITLISASEVFAQRGPRYNPPGRGDRHDSRPGPSHRPDYRHDNGPVYRHDYRPGPIVTGRVVISPRHVYRTGRIYRTYRRTPIIWSVPFGYSCNMFGDLALNGISMHNFRYNMDCNEAVSDIRLYGDFCDDDTMYDQSGYMEAQFSSRYECREALGYYY